MLQTGQHVSASLTVGIGLCLFVNELIDMSRLFVRYHFVVKLVLEVKTENVSTVV